MKQDLINPDLFGNEAGDDEDLDVLNSYFVAKPEFDRFFSSDHRLAFVRSRKGVGKSALLKQTQFRRQKSAKDELLIYTKASDLIAMQESSSASPAAQVYGWQQRICSRINLELGATLKIAFNDDKITLVEGAEVNGFKDRNLVSALFDRLKVKGMGAEIERTRQTSTNPQALLKRVLSGADTHVWLFVDDVDATFLNTEHERLVASTFFSACRNITTLTKGLSIRASVRSDVWPVLAQYDESLDKCEQYMIDLTWSTEETGRIITNKIHSYFQRNYGDDPRFSTLTPIRNAKEIRRLIFREPFPWGTRHIESFRPIHILSAGRPRWATQLCKLAGRDAHDKNAHVISMGHIRSKLRDYGQFRISDLYKEHRHQCGRIEEIVETFSGGPSRYTTDALLTHITNRIIRYHGIPQIDGVVAEKGGVSVAHFLYRIGFINARDENDAKGLGFIRFEDRPNLLSTNANLDDGLQWEIHPSYHEVLRIKRHADDWDSTTQDRQRKTTRTRVQRRHTPRSSKS